MIVIPTPSEAGNNRRKWTVIPGCFSQVHRLKERAWNSFLNEVWEFFVDFNYPSCCWTSLAHIIENWLCIIRTTGIFSLKAVTLLLIPHSLKTYQQSSLKYTTSETGEKDRKFFHYYISCDLCLHESFSFIPYFYNMWINDGNIKGLSEICDTGFLRTCILSRAHYYVQGGENRFLEGEKKQTLQWFVTLKVLDIYNNYIYNISVIF